MSEFTPLRRDLGLQQAGAGQQPVGVKFLYAVPDELPRLEKAALCEMFAEAQHRDRFTPTSGVRSALGRSLGMEELGPFYRSGRSARIRSSKRRANRRVYEVVPMLPKDTCASVAFARLEKLWFDPDLLIVSGPARKMEIILRALSWTIGPGMRAGQCPSWLRLDVRLPVSEREGQLLGRGPYLGPQRPRRRQGGRRRPFDPLGLAADYRREPGRGPLGAGGLLAGQGRLPGALRRRHALRLRAGGRERR